MVSKGNIKVMHVYGSLRRKYGGPATSVPSLCRELGKCGCDVSILTKEYDEGDIESPGLADIIRYSNLNRLDKLITQFDIVHINGVWPLVNRKIMRCCLNCNVKYIISPRASLMLFDINKSYIKIIKKYAAWHLYLKKNLQKVAGFHVTAINELDDLTHFNFTVPVAMIPNGINIKEYRIKPDKGLFEIIFPEIKGKKVILFFSRIVQNKGLLLLAHAWGKLSKDYRDWHLLIVGPDNENYWPRVQTIFNQYNSHNYTRSDYLSGYERMAVLHHADIFVLPTYWENFGIVVAESLMAGTPVITTNKTPWSELKTLGCGWITTPSVRALEYMLRKAMDTDIRTLKKMGRIGREYVSKYFDWRNIATDMKNYYEYILDKKDKPEFVHQLQGNGNPILPIRKPKNRI